VNYYVPHICCAALWMDIKHLDNMLDALGINLDDVAGKNCFCSLMLKGDKLCVVFIVCRILFV
jgi:hypothetical protein